MFYITIIIGIIAGVVAFWALKNKISKLKTRILISLGIAVAPFILVFLIFLLLFHLGAK